MKHQHEFNRFSFEEDQPPTFQCECGTAVKMKVKVLEVTLNDKG